MPEVMITILKFVGMASAAIFGVIGLLHDFRDPSGKVSKWGRASLIGIVVAAIISGATEVFSLVKAQSDSQAAAKRQEELLQRIDATTTKAELILRGVNRGVYPIENVTVSFEAELPINSAELSPFRERLRKEVAAFLKLPPEKQEKETGLQVIGFFGSDPYTLSIRAKNLALPKLQDAEERNAWALLSSSGIKMEFFSPPIMPEKYVAAWGTAQPSQGAGVSLWVGQNAPLLSPRDRDKFRLLYDINPERLYYSAIDVAVPDRELIITGGIIGIPDLLGGQMFVRFYTGLDQPETNRHVNGLFNDVRITAAGVAFKGARSFWFREHQLSRHTNEKGISYHVFQFPSDLQSLFNNRLGGDWPRPHFPK